MSEGAPPPQDQGAQAFARGIGGAGGPQDNTKPATNMQEFMDQLFEQLSNWVSKSTGVKIDSFFKTGMLGGTKLEDAGIRTGKSMIESSVVQGPQGGVLANAFSTFKWWGGDAPSATPIEAASGGDGGGGGGGGGDSFAGSGGGNAFESYVSSHPDMGEMFIAAGGGNRFSFADVPWEGLGTFSPPNVGSGPSLGEGMALA